MTGRDSGRGRPEISAIAAAISGSCPRCGRGRLYAGLLRPAGGCPVCGLDYSFVDSGDGPAVFVILILGFVVLAFALVVETVLAPPVWVHVLVWPVIVVAAAIAALRFAKAFLIALQYRTQAGEAEFDE